MVANEPPNDEVNIIDNPVFRKLQTKVIKNLLTSFADPLTRIKGFARVLRLGVHGTLTKSQKLDIDRIIDSCDFLTFQIREGLDLLDLSLIPEVIQLTPYLVAQLELRELCEQVVYQLTPLADAKNQFLEFNPNDTFLSNELIYQNVEEASFNKKYLKYCIYYFVYYLIFQYPSDSTITVTLEINSKHFFIVVIELSSKITCSILNIDSSEDAYAYLNLSKVLAEHNGGRIIEVGTNSGSRYEIEF